MDIDESTVEIISNTDFFQGVFKVFTGSRTVQFRIRGGPDVSIGLMELRQLVHKARWQRADPVIQLPPGSTHKMTYSVTTGLSIEHSRTLAKSLGMSVGGDLIGLQTKLNSNLKQKAGFNFEVTSQENRTTKLTLSNPANTRYRLFALWRLNHQIAVDALTVTPRKKSAKDLQPEWKPRGKVEFVMASEPFVTFIELDRPSSIADLSPPEP